MILFGWISFSVSYKEKRRLKGFSFAAGASSL